MPPKSEYLKLIELAEFNAGIYAAAGNERDRVQCLRIASYLHYRFFFYYRHMA